MTVARSGFALALLLAAGVFAEEVHEDRSTITLDAAGQTYTKRFVLRYPGDWNRRLVIGAHGGSGGDNYSRDGEVIGTDEVSLDDVIGDFALARGFAYASIDRDGIGGTAEGVNLTKAFTLRMRSKLGEATGRDVDETYIAGLSMGGLIARRAAEDPSTPYDGVIIIVGAGGDLAAQRERSMKMAELWPKIQSDTINPEIYAAAVRTPVEAARFWPFMGASASARSERPSEEDDTTGAVVVPTIEVAGTYDDFVYPEILVYREKVHARGKDDLHRLYEVEGAWHISRDDDAISSFQYVGSRMGLSEETLDQMATGASYLPTVHDALLLLDAWVSRGETPPPDRALTEGTSLIP